MQLQNQQAINRFLFPAPNRQSHVFVLFDTKGHQSNAAKDNRAIPGENDAAFACACNLQQQAKKFQFMSCTRCTDQSIYRKIRLGFKILLLQQLCTVENSFFIFSSPLVFHKRETEFAILKVQELEFFFENPNNSEQIPLFCKLFSSSSSLISTAIEGQRCDWIHFFAAAVVAL